MKKWQEEGSLQVEREEFSLQKVVVSHQQMVQKRQFRKM